MTAALLVVTVGLVALLRYEGLDRTKLLAARACSKALAVYAAREAVRRRRLVGRLAERALAERALARAARDERRYNRSEARERWAAALALELAAWVDGARWADAAALPPGQLPAEPETFDLTPSQNREGVE